MVGFLEAASRQTISNDSQTSQGVLGSIWVYPHVKEYAGELGLVQFRMNLEARMRSEPVWTRSWHTNFNYAKKGDTVVFAFREHGRWYVVGDAVVFDVSDVPREPEVESGWKIAPRYECFRLYPRNIPYEELQEKLVSFRPSARKVVKLDSEDYLRLLELAVTRS
jgi:hypothetical protein